MARASDGASGPALGKPVRVSPSGVPGSGSVPSKGVERPKGADRPASRLPRLQVPRLPRLWGEAMQFLREVRAEMDRVAWPDRQTVIASTLVVVFVLVVTAVYLAGWDYIFAELFARLFKR